VATRRWYIDHREQLAAAVRRKYARNRAYRKKKIAAARRQSRQRTLEQKAIIAERRCMLRWKPHARTPQSRWPQWSEYGHTILLQELMHPRYIIEHPNGRRELEVWPLNDLASFWLADSASVSNPPTPTNPGQRTGALSKKTGQCPGKGLKPHHDSAPQPPQPQQAVPIFCW
jgi:hypothetical protein